MYIAVSKQTEKKEGKEKEVSMATNHLHTFRTSYQSKYYLTDTRTVLYTLAHCKKPETQYHACTRLQCRLCTCI